MQLNKKTEYAILGTLYLASRPEKGFIKITEISQKGNLPKALMLKIFNTLVQHNILKSKSGINGGFKLSKSPEKISLLDIIRIFENSSHISCCTSKTHCTSAESCGIGAIWHEAERGINSVFQNISLKKLVEKTHNKSNVICNVKN
jgi:Rrf2 family protein